MELVLVIYLKFELNYILFPNSANGDNNNNKYNLFEYAILH